MADEELRAEGKRLYERGRWNDAVAKYGEYINLLLTVRENDGRLVIGYSNRAQAFLQLGMYADALEDTKSALNLDPHHLKSLVRKAKALEGLKLYQDAVAIYTSLLGKDDLSENHEETIQHSLRDAETKDRQTRLGEFGDILSDWYNLESKDDKFQEFVGPVELKRVCGMDRGLFATRDVERGELLFVAKAITAVEHPKGFQHTYPTVLSLLSGLEKRVTHACHNLKDFSQAQLLVQLDALAGPYSAGPLSRDIPPMRYFTPVNALAPNLRKLTSRDLQHPTFTTEFTRDMLLQVVQLRQYTSMGVTDATTGIYCLPSLLNHSCLPNVFHNCYPPERRETLFFRASHQIRKGDQLFSSYHDTFCPLDERRTICDKTICKCARCVLEKRLLKQVPALRILERECTNLWQHCRRFMIGTTEREQGTVRNQCMESIKSVEQLLLTNSKLRVLNATEKDWIRAAFIRFYLLLVKQNVALWETFSEKDLLLQVQMNSEAVRVIRTINPASGVAMSLSWTAVRHGALWFHWNRILFGIMCFAQLTEASVEITQLLKKLETDALEIGRLVYGSQVNEQALHTLFLNRGILLGP